MIAILSTIFAISLWAGTEATIVDSCSNRPVALTTPSGVRLVVNITELDPSEPVNLTILWRPAGIVEDLGRRDQQVWRYSLKGISADGTISRSFPIPKAKWLWQVEKRYDEYRIWDAEITWTQSRSHKAGSTITTFYHAPNTQPYFKIKSDSICEWEDKPTVSSKLYENLTTTWMNIDRQYPQNWERGGGPGFSLGYNNNNQSTVPLGLNGGDSYGWAFKDWTTETNREEIFAYERRFVLNRDEAGVFVERLAYTRHEAERYEWIKDIGACGEFKKVDEGLLDIGMPTEDFIILPRSYHPRTEIMNDYISIARPPVNTCLDSIGTGSQFATDILPAGQKGILFYYQQSIRSLR